MQSLHRRQFLRQLRQGLGGLLLVANTPLITACAGPAPTPFIAGNIVSPPLGCKELLARDERGDC